MRCMLTFACLLAVGAQVAYSVPVCASGWVAYRESCYFFGKDFVTWIQAAAECRKLGAHLVTVNDDLENLFLSGYIRNPAVAWYYNVPGGRSNDKWPWGNFGVTWIGLTDLYQEGSWRWVDTDSPFSYKAWKSGQPDNANGNEHCAHYYVETMWSDLNCHYLGTYICEK